MSWPLVPLKELVEQATGGASLKRDQFTAKGLSVIPKKAISSAIDIPNDKFVFTTEAVFESFSRSVVDENFVVTTLRDLVPSGPNLGRICNISQAGSYLLAQGVHAFKLLDGLNPRYLAYVSNSKEFRSQVLRIKVGSTQVHARSSEYQKIVIPVPPLEEQIRIAAILDKADAIRRKRQQAIELADQFLKSVFLDMFGDPVTNPKGWEVRALKDIARIQIGPFGTQLHKSDYIEGGIPLINPTHIVNGKIVPSSSLTISNAKFVGLSEYHLELGDIIMGRRGEMGRCALVTERERGWMCGTGSLYIRSEQRGAFLQYLFGLLTGSAVKAYLESESLGATLPNLNKAIVGSIAVPIPRDEVLDKYMDIRAKTMELQRKEDLLDRTELFEALAQAAFKGELTSIKAA